MSQVVMLMLILISPLLISGCHGCSHQEPAKAPVMAPQQQNSQVNQLNPNQDPEMQDEGEGPTDEIETPDDNKIIDTTTETDHE